MRHSDGRIRGQGLAGGGGGQNHGYLTIALPDDIRLLLLVHAGREHSSVAFVHCVCDLVREQVGCGMETAVIGRVSDPPLQPAANPTSLPLGP